MKRRGTAPLFVMLVLGCESGATSPADSCQDLGGVTHAASAMDRKLLGNASDYLSEDKLERSELVSSQRARRQAAWRVVERVVASTVLPGASRAVPTFRTWNDRDDLKRVFDHLYEQLGEEGRSRRTGFDRGDIAAGFAWNPTAIDELANWPQKRQAEYENTLTTATRAAGLGGIRRIALSPAASQHVLAGYGPSIDCIARDHPAILAEPTEVIPLYSTNLRLSACQAQRFGPYPVVAGSALVARASSSDNVSLQIRTASGEPVEQQCTPTNCSASGPGVFFVTATSTQTRTTNLEIEEHRVPQQAPVCLAGWFPEDSASVAEEWRRIDPALPFYAFDTTASSLEQKLGPHSEASWGTGERAIEPSEEAIYTVSTAADTSFRLAGMHIRAREAGTWLYITLWWSDTPDTDFGADRPVSLQNSDGPWRNYKMCASVDFNELDPDPQGGFGQEAPSLGDALAAVHEGEAGPSWCSNPYIDGARYLVRSNCVGCHQHAMTGVTSAESVNNEGLFPSFGRLRARDDLPADGFWGLDAGDGLAQMFSETVDWWRSGQP